MRQRLKELFLAAVLFAIAIGFVVKFAGPKILRAYIETGIGSCSKIPILCMVPEEAAGTFKIENNYIQELVRLKFPKTEISVPKGFKVVQELIKRPYYKKRRPRNGEEPVIYLLHQPADFFINLFPQVRKSGINNNYEFWHNIMYARESGINNLNDAFFVIMKSIFTPDLGNQGTVKVIQFKLKERAYFISYNLSGPGNYFDCSIIAKEGDFFKVYIKDKDAALDLNKVVAIISTVSPA